MMGIGSAAGEVSDVSDVSEALVIFLLCVVLAAGFAFASYVLAPQDVDEPQTLGALFLWIPIVLAMVYTAGRGSAELAWSIEERWLGMSDAADWFMRVYIASNIVAIGIEVMAWWTYERSKGIKLSARLPMLAHHILSIIAYINSLCVAHRMGFFACFDGLCEVSTFFLGFLQMSKIKGGTFAKRFQARYPRLLIVNGLCLWLSFLLFRVLLFPCWLALFLHDIYTMPYAIWAQLSWFELVFYPGVTLFLFSLSCMWFVRLSKGVIKVLSAGGDVNKSGDSGLQRGGLLAAGAEADDKGEKVQ
eukprot:g2063.t1